MYARESRRLCSLSRVKLSPPSLSPFREQRRGAQTGRDRIVDGCRPSLFVPRRCPSTKRVIG